MASAITPDLIKALVAQYKLNPEGPHGLIHWARVLENGRSLVNRTGADLEVVELFSVFHDSCRKLESFDPEHGIRAARLAHEWRGYYFDLDDNQFMLLQEACEDHARGLLTGNITLLTCWDADRLDLARLGADPEERRFATPEAKDDATRRWASQQSLSKKIPDLIMKEWGIDLRAGKAEE